jgi:hypothetical protein
MHRIPLMILVGCLLWLPAAPTTAGVELEIESGAFWQTRNDQQIPNSSAGTRFSLVDLVGEGPFLATRIYLTWNLDEKHSLRGLYAPLEITETGTPEVALAFAGGDFAAGVPAEALYRFNSYRLTYAYRLSESENWRWRLGFTAKIRDARVQLTQNELSAKKDDVGFVPLLHLEMRRALGDDWFVDLDLDALAGGPGRAIDGALKLGYAAGDRWRLTAGYRTVEGGADVDEVYNFAWLHYAVGSLVLSF